jgi:hypothetical protein
MSTPSLKPIANSFGPTQASRVKGFATFFKSYMSVWTIVIAALPIPVGAFKLIPCFEAQRGYLSIYTSMFCFLSLGFIFFQRHVLGYYMFRSTGKWVGLSLRRLSPGETMAAMTRAFVNWLPLLCICLSVYAVFRYQEVFTAAVVIAQAEATAEQQRGALPSAFLADIAAATDRQSKVKLSNLLLLENNIIVAALHGKESSPETSQAIFNLGREKALRYVAWNWGTVPALAGQFLRGQSENPTGVGPVVGFIGLGVPLVSPESVLGRKLVPLSAPLMMWYLIIFVAAETAFILMALKEYLQDLAQISDLSLMGIEKATAAS